MKKIFFIVILSAIIFSASAQNIWTQKANFGGSSRGGAASFSIGTKGYIGTGYDSLSMRKDFWEWDQTTNVWTQKADFGGGPRCFAAGLSIGNKGYIGTGYGPTSHPTKDFWEYDPTTNIWTQKANVGGPARDCPICFSIGNIGFIGTGDDNNISNFTLFNDFWEYHPSNNTWIQRANFGGGVRTNAVGFSVGGKGYAGAGSDNSSGHPTSDFWEYDPSSYAWTQKANYSGGKRWITASFSIGNKGYVGAGLDSAGAYHNDFWEFDPLQNTWTQMAAIPGNRQSGAAGFSIGNKGYWGTGVDTVSNLITFYEYTPSLTGIEDASTSFSVTISVFPNPFTSSATFDLSKEFKNAQLKLFDVAGKEVRSINFSGKQIILEREELESGIYFYLITSENKTISSGKLSAQ